MSTVQSILKLKGVVQHYSWGGFDYIPRLLSIPNEEKKPFAEYWLGAHPNYPAQLVMNGQTESLIDHLQSNGEQILGTSTFAKFSSLPFLLKILDVRQMLSIQVHPSKAAAAEGYAREDKSGISLKAPNRNYKDENHKPEMMVALSEFWLLHGFKPEDELREMLSVIPELEALLDRFNSGGYKGLYEWLMRMDQQEVNDILSPLASSIVPLYRNGELLPSQESFWAARAVESFCKDGNLDRGIFSVYLFNLVQLKKGEGIYQPPGMPHAYLEGQNVELMANSDNVLRAGLTEKYIDVEELLKHVEFVATHPQKLGSEYFTATEYCFDTPAEEFRLCRYLLNNDKVPVNSRTAEIIIVTEGAAQLSSDTEKVVLTTGEAVLITAGTEYTFGSTDTPTEAYRAFVPD